MYLSILRVHFEKKKKKKKKISQGLIKWCLCHVFVFFFSLNFIIKAYNVYYGYSFELHQQVDAIQKGTHNIHLYKEVDKKYTGCYQKTMGLLNCELIVCVILLNMVVQILGQVW